ncbi:methyltransferase domain-containing protein [Propionivibrio soli]|uniref:methyltransferase domain-containing protein n=1 Tax=Propionivibrio soli TaxID=2976531 RepID=UPI0021E73A06|nr:methyltransferase domain-containing protein [Propionivibrio soli]
MPPTESETQKSYCVVLIQPEGYQHSAALSELAETLLYGLAELGVDFQLSINEIVPGRTHIVLGAHLLAQPLAAGFPPGTIIYNSEQVDSKSGWMKPAYTDLLRAFEVWDYSEENIRRLTALGVTRVKYVPIGYVPQLTRIPTVAQDIDVLFYGAINERRKNILEALIARGLRIEFLAGVYREERDRYIARAKVILNVHYYEASVFEIVRVSYLLANEKAVVAECGDATTLEPDIRDAVCAVPYDGLADACVKLVRNASERANLARRGFEVFVRRKEGAILGTALGLAASPTNSNLPAFLNLGSGKDWRENCFNVDISETVRPDAIFDAGQPLGAGQIVETKRFGAVKLTDNQFEAIFANDVLEHIPDLPTAMTNCLRLLKPGGTFHIYVPYDLSLGAWQDPTHIRAFNENSWLYYTDWYWYMGWTEARFEQLGLEFRLSELGKRLQSEGMPIDVLARTPRAVDGMEVVLRKRYLLESEAARAATAMRRPWDDEADA